MKIYEMHVKGTTKLNHNIPEHKRGKILGISDPWMIKHYKRLGVNVLQLMPIQTSSGASYWGYDPIDWFSMDEKFGTLEELKMALSELHDAGIKVIMDVVYNHTGDYIDGVTYCDSGMSGCGWDTNPVASLGIIHRSIDYWLRDVGVDGMRFDLASALFWEDGEFKKHGKFSQMLSGYSDKILVSESWSCKDYQFGNMPDFMLELSGDFRDKLRQGHHNIQTSPRDVLMAFCHDGKTMHDNCTYEGKYNWVNGENNRDGGDHDYSYNFGCEGETDCPDINAARTRHKKWLTQQLYSYDNHTLWRAGDEVRQTYNGSNNAYSQYWDSPHGWIHWDQDKLEEVYSWIDETKKVKR